LDSLEDFRVQWNTGIHFPDQFATSLSPTCAILFELPSSSALKQLVLAITIDYGGSTNPGSGFDVNWSPLSTIVHPGSPRFPNLESFQTLVRLDMPSLDSHSEPLRMERIKNQYRQLVQKGFVEAFKDFAEIRTSHQGDEGGAGNKVQCAFHFVTEGAAESKLSLVD
jgi:hypothetical protein